MKTHESKKSSVVIMDCSGTLESTPDDPQTMPEAPSLNLTTIMFHDLKPAVNRQPKFPRGRPEELANVHNVRDESYMSAPHLPIPNEM